MLAKISATDAHIAATCLFKPLATHESKSYPHSPAVYHPVLCALAGNMTAGIFLSRAIHWWNVKGRKAYHKANDNDNGRSWCEQEGFTRSELQSSRGRVATKVKKAEVKQHLRISAADLETHEKTRTRKGVVQVIDTHPAGLKRCVLYWRNGSNRMWYRVNEALVVALMLKHENPDRDNVDILRDVAAQYPDAEIALPEPRPQPKIIRMPQAAPQPQAPKPARAWLSNYAAVVWRTRLIHALIHLLPEQDEDTEDDAPPPPKRKKPPRYRVAVAMAFNFADDDGHPNPKAPLVGRYTAFLLGKAKSGEWGEWCLKEDDTGQRPFTAEEVVGFSLWYKKVMEKTTGEKPDGLPRSTQTLNRRALEFLSISDKNRQTYIDAGRERLERVLDPDAPPLHEPTGEHDTAPFLSPAVLDKIRKGKG